MADFPALADPEQYLESPIFGFEGMESVSFVNASYVIYRDGGAPARRVHPTVEFIQS